MSLSRRVVLTWRRLLRAARDAVEAEAESCRYPVSRGGSSSVGTTDAVLCCGGLHSRRGIRSKGNER